MYINAISVGRPPASADYYDQRQRNNRHRNQYCSFMVKHFGTTFSIGFKH